MGRLQDLGEGGRPARMIVDGRKIEGALTRDLQDFYLASGRFDLQREPAT